MPSHLRTASNKNTRMLVSRLLRTANVSSPGSRIQASRLTGTRCSRRTSKRILRAGRTETVRPHVVVHDGLEVPVQQPVGSTHSSHSTVVPLMRTNGRPTPVCQSWGDCEQKGAGSGDQYRRKGVDGNMCMCVRRFHLHWFALCSALVAHLKLQARLSDLSRLM